VLVERGIMKARPERRARGGSRSEATPVVLVERGIMKARPEPGNA
jgi:hypothetical protein